MKYLADGRQVEVVQHLESGFLVQTYYGMFDPESGPYLDSGNLQIVERVFDEPPVAVFHESITELNEEIERLKQTKASLLSECKEVEKAVAEAKAKRDRHEQLRLLDDFIAGKITHYVEIQYREPRIIEFSEATCDGGRDKKLRLLTLFGNSDGKLDWKLNRYRDGSGHDSTVIPVTSYEEAL
jgi:chorismate mutase